MSDPETDDLFRERLMREVIEDDRDQVMRAKGKQLDVIGRKYDLFRTGVPLDGFDGFEDGIAEEDQT